MPTYDYVCDACGHAFEQWQSFTAEKLTKCPACKKNKLQRLMGTGAAIVFKGSGFYDTDYRQADEKKKQEAANKNKPAEETASPTAEKSAAAPASESAQSNGTTSASSEASSGPGKSSGSTPAAKAAKKANP